MMRTRPANLIAAGLICLVLLGATWTTAQQATLFVKNGQVGIGVDLPDFLLHLRQSDGTGAGFRVETTGAAQNFSWFFQQNAGTGAFLITPFEGGNAPLQIFPGAAEVIATTLVVRGGKVGIGTNSPEAKLHVMGNIKQNTKIIHPDYVFAPGYDLESIDDHAEYMWSRQHLPAVGPGEYDSEGVAVIDWERRSQGVLEELEKAHIYIAQLDEKMAALQDRMDTQERDALAKNDEIDRLERELSDLQSTETN